MSPCLQKDSAIKALFYSCRYVNRKGKKQRRRRRRRRRFQAIFFPPLIGLKLSGRNGETINCAFFNQCGTVWRRFHGGPPVLPATIFPSASHSFCLSHFSINLHNLTLFIEPGSRLLRRTNKILPFSLCLTTISPFFPPHFLHAATPLGGGISAQEAELHGALQGLAGMRLYVSD